jgi:tetratricopeptide (TPR) repeat protein
MSRAVPLAAPALLLARLASAAGGPPLDALTQKRALEHYRAGQQLLLSDAYAGAADEFRAAVDLDARMALAHYGLGQSYMGLKSYVQAIGAYTRCRQAYEELAAENLDFGDKMNARVEDEIRALQDQQRQAEDRLRQVGGSDRNLQRAAYQIQQRITQLEVLRQRREHPLSVPAGLALALGSAYLRAGQFDAAEREYLVALEGNPKMGEAHNNLAYVYMVTGRLADAQRELKLAEKNGFRVNPEFKAELKQKLE